MFAIGNGESRKDLNLNKFTETKVGCNAIVRDFHVENVICCDRRCVDEAITLTDNTTLIHTREDWIGSYSNISNVTTVPSLKDYATKKEQKGATDFYAKGYAKYHNNYKERWQEPFQWGSGCYAILLAALLTTNKEVKIIGFDLWGVGDTTENCTEYLNNIYKDTKNYNTAINGSVDPRYWILQIQSIFNWFPHINFKIYQKADWTLPESWKKPNVSVDNLIIL